MSSMNIGTSFAVSLCLSTLFFFLGWLSIHHNFNLNIVKWLIFPVIAYVVSFCMNAVAQYISCKKINTSQLILSSFVVPGFVIMAFIATLITLIRSPIEVVISPSSRALYGPIFAISFYVFWATMFGEALSVGISTTCPS